MYIATRQVLCYIIVLAVTLAPAWVRGDSVQPTQIKESVMESSKRRAPAAKPVTHEGIRYEQLRAARSRSFGQNGGVIVAIEVSSGRELWTLQLYTTQYDPNEETDAQDVYIEELRIDSETNSLIARDERGRTYTIDLGDRTVSEEN
jgi:hypothetical protein